MRITNNMLINSMMYYMNNNLDRMQKFQSQLSTGKKITVPSDDPIVAAKALKLRTDVSEVDQFKRNTNDGYSWMDITENTLGKMGDLLQRARELAVQAANGSMTSGDREKIKQEIDQLKGQSIHLANSTYAGRYIFSGFSTDTKLMRDDGTYDVSVSSNETAVVKGGLLSLSAAQSVDTEANNTFTISVDGANYYTVSLSSGTKYDGSEDGMGLDDLAAEIQNALQSAAPVGEASSTPPTALTDIKVTNNDGRIEFSLRDTLDPNGNRLKIYLKNGETNDLLESINIKTDPVTLTTVSKGEDIKYQVGVSDLLNVNVLGTDLFGAGKKGDLGEYIIAFNRYIDSLAAPDDGKSYIYSQQLAANETNKINIEASNNKFSIKVGTMEAPVEVTLTANIYDGTEGKSIDNLAADMQENINTALSSAGAAYTVTVKNQDGKLVISENSGAKIVLQEGPPTGDALRTLKLFTDVNKTLTSATSPEGISNAITMMESLNDRVMSIRSDIGARMNRAELTLNRLENDDVNFTKLMSDNEDVDMAETITNLKNEENVYRASLSGGARIIMPTLLDFLR